MSKGDRVNFNIAIENDSSIKVRYRVVADIENVTGDLKTHLVLNAPIAEWYSMEIEEKTATIPCSIELPIDSRQSYDGSEVKIKVTVQAIQYSAKLSTCTFYNEDGSEVLWVDEFIAGTAPSFGGEYPYYESDEQYAYSFLAWNQDLTGLYGDVEIFALMKKEVRTYIVTYLNYDGTLLHTEYNVTYGETKNPNIKVPLIPTDYENYVYYEYKGWDKNDPITGDTVKTAQFEAKPIITFVEDTTTNSYTITDIDNKYRTTEFIIPSTYRGLPVTRIANYAFGNNGKTNYDIMTIRIPSSITTIDRYAFYSNNHNSYNNYADYILYIERETPLSTYYGVINDTCRLRGVYYGVTDDSIYQTDDGFVYFIKNGEATLINYLGDNKYNNDYDIQTLASTVEVPTVARTSNVYPVTKIGSYSLINYSKGKHIVIPDGVTSIGYHAFHGLTKLRTVDFPTSLKSIEYGAFYNCKNLEHLFITSNITTLGANLFESSDDAYTSYYAELTSHKLVVFVEDSRDKSLWHSTWDDNLINKVYYGCTSDRLFIEDDFVYYIKDDNEAICAKYIGLKSCQEKTIPSTINGHTVTEFGKGCMREHTDYYVSVINAPNTIKIIDDYAFGDSGIT